MRKSTTSSQATHPHVSSSTHPSTRARARTHTHTRTHAHSHHPLSGSPPRRARPRTSPHPSPRSARPMPPTTWDNKADCTRLESIEAYRLSEPSVHPMCPSVSCSYCPSISCSCCVLLSRFMPGLCTCMYFYFIHLFMRQFMSFLLYLAHLPSGDAAIAEKV